MAFFKKPDYLYPQKDFFCHNTVSLYLGKISMPKNWHPFCHCASGGGPMYKDSNMQCNLMTLSGHCESQNIFVSGQNTVS